MLCLQQHIVRFRGKKEMRTLVRRRYWHCASPVKSLEVREEELATGLRNLENERKKFDKERQAVSLGQANVKLGGKNWWLGLFAGFALAICVYSKRQGELLEEKKNKRKAYELKLKEGDCGYFD